MRKFVCILFLMFSLSFAFSKPVSAGTFEIHAIYLKGCKGGDAVLVKSNDEYILMDTGKVNTSRTVVSYLKKHNVTSLSVYISHAHEDHVGGLKAVAGNFTINKIYMPSRKIAAGAKLGIPCYGIKKVSKIYSMIRSVAKKEQCPVVELSRGKSFTIGDARFKVIGPIGKLNGAEYAKIKKSKYRAYGKNVVRYLRRMKDSDYINGMSLSALITCNNVKYLTMGDTIDVMEGYIARIYNVNSDILKMSHHANDNATSSFLLKRSTPKYVFASSGLPKSSTAKAEKRVRAIAHVKPLITGRVKKNIVYKIDESGKIRVYKTR